MSSASSSATPSVAAALAALDEALAKLTSLPAKTLSSSYPLTEDFKLFELKLTTVVLAHIAPATKWTCSTAPKLVLSPRPQELSKATIFSRPGSAVSVAMNVNVHYAGSPWLGARHEADVAVYSSHPAKATTLDHVSVRAVFEAKYRKSVPKSVLRELAFISHQLGRPGLTVLATPRKASKKTAPPHYWREAEKHYGVRLMYVSLP